VLDICFKLEEKMKYLVFIMIWFLTNSYGQSIKENVGNSLAERFPGKIIEFENFLIPEEIKSEIEIKAKQRFFRNELYLWKLF